MYAANEIGPVVLQFDQLRSLLVLGEEDFILTDIASPSCFANGVDHLRPAVVETNRTT